MRWAIGKVRRNELFACAARFVEGGEACDVEKASLGRV